jgi:hypothetical protein
MIRVPGGLHRAAFVAALIVTTIQIEQAIPQTANSNAGLQGGQDGMFDAILATPNYMTPVCRTALSQPRPGLEKAVPTPQFKLNVLAPALYNSNAQFLSSGGSKTLEGRPLVRPGWASLLFDTPIRVSGAASLETERFVNAPGAAIDYIWDFREGTIHPSRKRPRLFAFPVISAVAGPRSDVCQQLRHPAGFEPRHRQGVQF